MDNYDYICVENSALYNSSSERVQNLPLNTAKGRTLDINPKEISPKTTERLHFLQDGINRFYRYMFPVLDSSEELLKTNSYKAFMAHHPKADAYRYPTERIFVFFPECILWGSRADCSFIVGRGLNGSYIKVRYYQSTYYYTGMHFRHPLFGTRGSRWLVGCSPCNDAVNLVFAFPLDIKPSPTLASIPSLSLDERTEILEQIKKL